MAGGLVTRNALGSGKRGLLAAGGNISPVKSRSRQLAAKRPLSSSYLCRFVGAGCTATSSARALGESWVPPQLHSGKALAPFVRVARSMKYSVDRDRSLRRFVKHGVRKAAYERATVAFVHDRVHLGSAPDAFQARID